MRPPKSDVTKDENHLEDLRLILEDVPDEIPRRGIIHVGAHEGQEVGEYFAAGFERVALVEANPQWCATLHARFDGDPRVRIFETAIADRAGTMTLHIHTSRRGSTEPASLLPMKEFNRIVTALHTPACVEVPVTTLDALAREQGLNAREYNFLSLDIQGAEMLALRGADATLRTMDAIICEVALLELYEGQALEAEIVDFLGTRGCEKRRTVYHTMYEGDRTFPAWGEALFTRRASLPG